MENKKELLIYSVLLLSAAGAITAYHFMVGFPSDALFYILLGNFVCMVLFICLLPSYAFQSFCFLLAFSTGFYGYLAYAVGDYSISSSLYSTFRLFLMNADHVFAGTSYPLTVEIARWSAAVYTVYTLLTVAYKFFGQSMKLFWYKFRGNHCIVYGCHYHAKVLIRNLRKQKKRVIVIAEKFESADRAYLEETGAVVLLQHHQDGQIYRKSKLKKASYFFIFDHDDTKNLDELISFQENFLAKSANTGNLKVYIHLKHQNSLDLYEKIENKLKSNRQTTDDKQKTKKSASQTVTIRTINMYQLVAEKLWNDYPLYQGYENRVRDKHADPLHLTVIGLGETGKSIMLEALERAHFSGRKKTKFTVLDRASEKLEMKWQQRFPGVAKIADINFYAYDSETTLIDDFAHLLTDTTHLIISLPDDYLNMMVGIELAKKFPDKPVFIKMIDEALVSHWLHFDRDEFKNLFCFGNWNDVLNEEYFINEKIDELAKQVHKSYIKDGGKGVSPAWEELTDFIKESNRKQTNHALTKLILLGFSPVKELAQGQVAVSEETFTRVKKEKLNELAAIEHERWNAFHYIRGWETYHEVSKHKSKDEKAKLHGCLVPFEELPKISQIVGNETPYEKYDYSTIDLLDKTVENMGYKIIETAEEKA